MSGQKFRIYGYFFVLVSFYFLGLAAYNLFVFFAGDHEFNRLFGGFMMIVGSIACFWFALFCLRRSRDF